MNVFTFVDGGERRQENKRRGRHWLQETELLVCSFPYKGVKNGDPKPRIFRGVLHRVQLENSDGQAGEGSLF